MAKKRLKKQPAKANRNAADGSFQDRLVRWGVIGLVSAWMFLLGVLVGRGTAPIHFEFDSLQKELIDLRDRDVAEAERRIRIDAESLNGQPELGFHEALKTSDESEGIERKPAVPSDDPTKRPSAEHTAPPRKIENKTPLMTKGPRPSNAERKPATEIAASPDPETTEKAAPESKKAEPLAVSPGGEAKFTVQVASFRKADDADRMVAELKKKHYPAYRIAGIIPSKGIWHRVRVGGFENSAAAKAMVRKLKSDRITAFVVSGK